jgi:hypothetical protein
MQGFAVLILGKNPVCSVIVKWAHSNVHKLEIENMLECPTWWNNNYL